MEFKSLNDAFTNNFIKSLPHLTWLDLTANEKLLIELVLSFTHKELPFYMNHSLIADYLALKDTKNKAKTVGNIIRELLKKGYLTKQQTFNYNGKKGGSSVTLLVDEVYLEERLHDVFNPTLQSTEIVTQTNKDFLAELEEMDDEPKIIPDLPYLVKLDSTDDSDEMDIEGVDFNYMEFETTEGFKDLLRGLMGVKALNGKIGTLQMMIDNKMNWDLDKMKEAFAEVILK